MASSTRQLYTGKLTVATATPTVGVRLPTFAASSDLPEANQTAVGTLVWLIDDILIAHNYMLLIYIYMFLFTIIQN